MATGSTTQRRRIKRTLLNRIRRYGILLLLVTVSSLICLPSGLGVLSAVVLTNLPCDSATRSPDDFGDDYQWESVTIPAEDNQSFEAYIVHGNNGATIIYPPTLGNSRSSRLNEALPLNDAGYTIVTFEARPCAGMGPISLGYNEARDINATVSYLGTRDYTDANRIGIHGFSSSGAAALMAAAQNEQLWAVIASGGYADMDDIINMPTTAPLLVDFYRFGIRNTYRLIIGSSITNLSPISSIADIAPRPILLIYGSKESSLAGAYQQLEAAGDNAELWVVDDAGHGDYISVVGDDVYFGRVQAFYDKHLLDK